jgi:hypothetical protein
MPLSANQVRLLAAILEGNLSNLDGVNPTRFKLRHEDDIAELEQLESLQLIRLSDQGKYEIPLSSVIAMQGKAAIAEGLVSDCGKVFDALKRAFRADPDRQVALAELAKDAEIPIARVYAAVPYLAQAPIWANRSNDLRSPNSTIRASVDILKYKTFSDVVALFLRWAEQALQPIPEVNYTSIADAFSHLAPRGPETAMPAVPPSITESLRRFRKDYDSKTKKAFVMMQFGSTPAHLELFESIRSALANKKIVALRADSKHYHDDLFPNVLTYIYGCDFGIAVFERIEQEAFNPNVSLEVGYMFGLSKPVCLLKDRTLRTLHTDLVGKLYRQFDPQDPAGTIPQQLEAWLKDKDL